MRVVRAQVKDSYYVHKTMCEYLDEKKIPSEDLKKSYGVWLEKLSDPELFYVLMFHGRKTIGVVWGRQFLDESTMKKTILIEGSHLRSAYRGKGRFDQEFEKTIEELKKDFQSVRLLIPKGGDIQEKYKVIGTLVEE